MSHTDSDSPRAILPSWLLSVALHLLLLVLLGVFIRSPVPAGSGESDRTVAIALAQHDTDSTEYFDESDGVVQDSDSLKTESSTAPDMQIELPDKLPDDPRINVDLALPDASTVPVPIDSLFTAPDLSGGGKVQLLPNQGVSEILEEDSKQRRSRQPLGAAARISLFDGSEAEGRTFIFVIDRSDSMGSGGLGALAAAAREFERGLASLGPEHRFQILAYNHERVFFGEEEYVQATEPNKTRVGRFMRGLAAFGGTDHYLGISSALYRNPDVIFFLNDGSDPPLSPGQLVKIRRRAAGRTAIHCIQFGNRASLGEASFMQTLAGQNNGSFRYVNLSVR